MAFAVIASARQERDKDVGPARRIVITGLTFGGVAAYFALVGILLMFHKRWIIYEYL